MCGIAVAINWDDAERRCALIGGILHRGDISDPIASPRAKTAMGTRRLRIVDPEHGQQPQPSLMARFWFRSTAKSTTTKSCGPSWKALGLTFRTGSTPKCWPMPCGHGARGRWAGCRACSPLSRSICATANSWRRAIPRGQAALCDPIRHGFLFCSEIRPLLETAPEGE